LVTAQLRVGLGWHISRQVDRDIVWHNGQTGGSHGFIGIDKARHAAVVVLSNSVSSIDDIGVHLLDARVELAAAEEREELTLAPEVLERYVGVYQLSPEGTVTVTRTERGLVAEATGLGVAPIYAASETEFLRESDQRAAHLPARRHWHGNGPGAAPRRQGHPRDEAQPQRLVA
jgi:hypothetical protein